MSMRNIRIIAAIAAFVALAGCNQDSVLFITTASIGINVDSKPPTASIAYDRVEGFIGPRYDNGAVPPVIASLETDGTVFAPKVRQVYGTGQAAVNAVGTSEKTTSHELKGKSGSALNRLVFFGTGTTIGLKVGFGPEGAPDSLVFGYKRKEFSFIPLGTGVVGSEVVDVYPSVLASIDTATVALTLPSTGLQTRQFFATGEAAEILAANGAIRSAFRSIATDSLTAALSPDDQKKAKARADDIVGARSGNLNRIMAAVHTGGTFDAAKWGKLLDAGRCGVDPALRTAGWDQIRDTAGRNAVVVECLSGNLGKI